MSPHTRRYRILLAVSLLLLPVAVLSAQEVYLLSWQIQAPRADLIQPIAARTIALVNLEVTKDDPSAPTARLDDRLELTVIGRIDLADGRILEEIVRIRAGSIVIESDPATYLPSSLIDSLVRRNYYWRRESLEAIDADLMPEEYATRLGKGPLPPRRFESNLWRLESERPLFSVAVTPDVTTFVDVGIDEMLLPGLASNRVNLGIRYRDIAISMFGPHHLQINNAITGALSNDAGAAVSVRLGPTRFAGGVVFRKLSEGSSLPRLSSWFHGAFSSTIGQLGTWRVRYDLGFNVAGTGALSDTVNERATERSSLSARPYARFQFDRNDFTGEESEERGLYLSSFGIASTGSAIMPSLSVAFTPTFGLELKGAFHNLIFDSEPLAPPIAIWLGPTFAW